MKKFWEWIYKNEHGIEKFHYIYKDYDEGKVKYISAWTVQMLVGYMIDYLWQEHMIIMGHPTDSHRKTNINDYYKLLESKINSLE